MPIQNREHERGQRYCKVEALARLHAAAPMLIVQGTKGGRTKEQNLLGPVIPRSSLEWTPTSTTVSPSHLTEYVSSYLVLLVSCPRLTQAEAMDVLVGFGCFESPFTETLFHAG